MSDTITIYAGEEHTVHVIDPQPDPANPGYFLLKSQDGEPMRCKLSLKEHAYNIMLPPESFIIIDADEAEIFKDSRSDDRVTFILPSNDQAEFCVEQYCANAKGTAPYTMLALRSMETHRIISAALYPRDLENLPKPLFVTQAGKVALVAAKAMVADKTDAAGAKIEYAHSPHELEVILDTIYKPVKTIAPVDPNAPKEEWF